MEGYIPFLPFCQLHIQRYPGNSQNILVFQLFPHALSTIAYRPPYYTVYTEHNRISCQDEQNVKTFHFSWNRSAYGWTRHRCRQVASPTAMNRRMQLNPILYRTAKTLCFFEKLRFFTIYLLYICSC